jgi:hypothetical protein
MTIRLGRLPSRPPDRAAIRATDSYQAVLRDRPFRAHLLCYAGFVFFAYAQFGAGFSVYATALLHLSPRIVGAAFAANRFLIVAA